DQAAGIRLVQPGCRNPRRAPGTRWRRGLGVHLGRGRTVCTLVVTIITVTLNAPTASMGTKNTKNTKATKPGTRNFLFVFSLRVPCVLCVPGVPSRRPRESVAV